MAAAVGGLVAASGQAVGGLFRRRSVSGDGHCVPACCGPIYPVTFYRINLGSPNHKGPLSIIDIPEPPPPPPDFKSEVTGTIQTTAPLNTLRIKCWIILPGSTTEIPGVLDNNPPTSTNWKATFFDLTTTAGKYAQVHVELSTEIGGLTTWRDADLRLCRF